jgi:hypothetical protein
MRYFNYRLTTTLLVAAAGCGNLGAKDKHRSPDANKLTDPIAVEGHLAIANGPVTGFVATRQHGHTYVYAEHDPGKPVTLFDVTQPRDPRIIAEIESSGRFESANLLAATGTAALTVGEPANSNGGDAAGAAAGRTIRLMDFSDPANPKVTKQFEGVTAVGKVAGGLILLANPDGIWILSQHPAEDPDTDARYARKVVYGESMY